MKLGINWYGINFLFFQFYVFMDCYFCIFHLFWCCFKFRFQILKSGGRKLSIMIWDFKCTEWIIHMFLGSLLTTCKFLYSFYLYDHYLVLFVSISCNCFFSCDSGVYVMIFLEYWKSPRTSLYTLFKESDVPNLRIKVANDLLFSPKNSGRKDLVTSYKFGVWYLKIFLFPVLVVLLYFIIS